MYPTSETDKAYGPLLVLRKTPNQLLRREGTVTYRTCPWRLTSAYCSRAQWFVMMRDRSHLPRVHVSYLRSLKILPQNEARVALPGHV